MIIKNTFFLIAGTAARGIMGSFGVVLVFWMDGPFYHVFSVTSHNNPGVYMIASCTLFHLLFFQHTSSIAVISFHSVIVNLKKEMVRQQSN